MILPWNIAARIAVEHALEHLAARAMRHAVLDEKRRVAMLPVAEEKSAGNIGRGAFAHKAQIDLIARERGTGRELEGVVAGVGAKLDEPRGKVDCVAAFPLHLDVLHRGLGANPELGYGIALQAPAEAAEALDHRGGAAGLGNDDVTGEGRGGIARAVDRDEVYRLVEDDALAHAQGDAARHQRGVEGKHGVVVARIDVSKRLLQPGLRLLERQRERDRLDAGSFQAGEVRKIGPEIALDDDETIGGKARDFRAERLAELGIAGGRAVGLAERIDVGEPRAEVGIFPGLDAAMGQADAAVSPDRRRPQIRDEGIAGAGKRVLAPSRTGRDSPVRPWS